VGYAGRCRYHYPSRHEEPFNVYEWKHSKLEYVFYLNPDEIQALYIERNEA
jgi:hypothetical protein